MRVHRWVAFVVPCLVVSLFLVLGPVQVHQARAAGAEEQRLLELINGYRQENGAGPLVPSAVLSTSATRHSEDMATHGFFSHSTGESSYYPSGSSPADRAAREGYPANVYTAENIARGQLTAEEVFEDWRGSPEHDATMLDEQYTAAGIGHVGSYWTADFGSVADASPNVETLQPERIDEPKTGERASTPPSAAVQSTDEREGDERTAPDEPTPEEQAQLDGVQPETRDLTAEDELLAEESETRGQASTPYRATVGRTPDGETPTREETPDLEPNQETTSGAAPSPRPPSERVYAEQYAVETTPSEILSPFGEGLAIGGPENVSEEGLERVSPVETEAMETVLAAREDVPEDLLWHVPPIQERPAEEPAADQPPATSDLGTSGGGDVAGITPLATKELPETTTSSPLTLLLGCVLLLCGFLVFGATRGRRGS